MGGVKIVSIGNQTLTAANFEFYNLVYGDAGANELTGGAHSDYFYAEAGNDIVRGGDGNDRLAGADGNDYLSGGNGDESIEGDAGNDFIDAGSGSNIVRGGSGIDKFFFGAAGSNIIRDFSSVEGEKIGIATSIADDFSDLTITDIMSMPQVQVGGLSLILMGAQSISASDFEFYDLQYGTLAGDVLTGGANVDHVYGNSGDDTLYGADGNDKLFGGSNNDQLSGEAGNDFLYGGDGNDTLIGGSGHDQLFGDAGNDFLDAGIWEGFGSNMNEMTGGTGADIFYFADENAATSIMDFTASDGDKIRFSSALADDFSDLLIIEDNGTTLVKAADLSVYVWDEVGLTASNFQFV